MYSNVATKLLIFIGSSLKLIKYYYDSLGIYLSYEYRFKNLSEIFYDIKMLCN